MQLPAVFSRYRAAIEDEMRAVVGGDDTLLYRMMRYHLGWQESDGGAGPGAGGKAIRPALCLLACASVGGSVERALPAAAAIELLHNFSLVHDDIQDGDQERHHRPTVWAVWGAPQAINGGDGLWSLATRSFLRTAERSCPPATVLRALSRLNDACLTMIEGQSLDLAFERERRVTTDQYLDMIARKTGALIAAALAIGALLGSDDDTVAEQFARFGGCLGRIFQIQDDVLGIWGDSGLTGKSTTSDIRRRKQSYPIVYTLSEGPATARAALAEVYALPTIDGEAVERAFAALDEAGARQQAAALVAEAHADALALLDTLPVDAAQRAELREVAGFLIDRAY